MFPLEFLRNKKHSKTSTLKENIGPTATALPRPKPYKQHSKISKTSFRKRKQRENIRINMRKIKPSSFIGEEEVLSNKILTN